MKNLVTSFPSYFNSVADGCKLSSMCFHKSAPQGSFIGPLLINFMNEIGEKVRNNTVHPYTDDVILCT